MLYSPREGGRGDRKTVPDRHGCAYHVRIVARISYCWLRVGVVGNILSSNGKYRFGLQWSDFDFPVSSEECNQQASREVFDTMIPNDSWHNLLPHLSAGDSAIARNPINDLLGF